MAAVRVWIMSLDLSKGCDRVNWNTPWQTLDENFIKANATSFNIDYASRIGIGNIGSDKISMENTGNRQQHINYRLHREHFKVANVYYVTIICRQPYR